MGEFSRQDGPSHRHEERPEVLQGQVPSARMSKQRVTVFPAMNLQNQTSEPRRFAKRSRTH